MTQKRGKTQYQYEPLVTPQGWKDDEKRFAHRLTGLMDIIFQRLGRMEARLQALEAQKGEQSND